MVAQILTETTTNIIYPDSDRFRSSPSSSRATDGQISCQVTGIGNRSNKYLEMFFNDRHQIFGPVFSHLHRLGFHHHPNQGFGTGGPN